MKQSELSILIPARNEKYLKHTIADIFAKAVGPVQVLVGLDGCSEDLDPRVQVVQKETSIGMRQMINALASLATGKYLMKLDAHCLLAPGFDTQLIQDHQSGWVQIPRRYRLDAERWSIIEDGRPPVDYEHLLFAPLVSPGLLWGTPWDERTKERDVRIDDTMHFQGSCWFMEKEWFFSNHFLSLLYGSFAQESEEILFSTLLNGGQVKVNKNTYYAHLHKTQGERKWFAFSQEDLIAGNTYSYILWVKKHKDFFVEFINRFMPIPGWPPMWKEILWQN